MIESLRPYDSYIETDMPWMSRIPAHWAQRRMKFLFRERTDKGYPDEPLLAATQTKGVVKKEDYDTRTVTATKDFHLLKLVKEGDFVISLRSFQGGIEIAHCRGIISPAYTVLQPLPDTSEKYFSRFFKSSNFINALTLFVTGIREGQNIDYERLSRAYLPLPPLEEQIQIGRFLDWANGKIDRAIRAKKKIIALLNEQKQAIIHRAVTRGLDPNVKMKPSGIPWLEEIPANWELWRLGRFARIGNGSTPSRGRPLYWNGGTYPWLNSSQVNRGHIDSADQFVTALALSECHLPRVSPGSVVIAITGQGKTRGTPAILGIEATINQHLAYISPRLRIASPEFIHLALTGAYKVLRANSEDAGSTKGAITCEDLKRFTIAVPPVAEQEQLVKIVRAQTHGLACTINRLEQEVALFIEYRTRIVSDVVTGKLNVREAVSTFSDEEIPEEEVASADLIDESEILQEEEAVA